MCFWKSKPNCIILKNVLSLWRLNLMCSKWKQQPPENWNHSWLIHVGNEVFDNRTAVLLHWGVLTSDLEVQFEMIMYCPLALCNQQWQRSSLSVQRNSSGFFMVLLKPSWDRSACFGVWEGIVAMCSTPETQVWQLFLPREVLPWWDIERLEMSPCFSLPPEATIKGFWPGP